MEIKEITELCVAIGVILVTVALFLIKVVKQAKALKNAKTEAEKEAALNAMSIELEGFLKSAENKYSALTTSLVNAVAESTGTSNTTVITDAAEKVKTGSLKKDAVLSALQSYAIDKGYDFDREYWDKRVDDLIALTNEVNTPKK